MSCYTRDERESGLLPAIAGITGKPDGAPAFHAFRVFPPSVEILDGLLRIALTVFRLRLALVFVRHHRPQERKWTVILVTPGVGVKREC